MCDPCLDRRPSQPKSADATTPAKKEKRAKKDKGALAVNPVYRAGTLPGATGPSAAEDDPEAFDLDNYYADHRSKALERREENRLQVHCMGIASRNIAGTLLGHLRWGSIIHG